ncbi:MAG TPA: hypothetical protein VLA56_18365 [Pseudomonadales bacterium]|nr:hypothetical protein [Pseudomonadales bacterium]
MRTPARACARALHGLLCASTMLCVNLVSLATGAWADGWPERPPGYGLSGPDFTLVALPAAEERALLGRLEALARHGLSTEARAAIAGGEIERVTVWDANETRVRGRLVSISFAPIPLREHLRLRPVVSCGARDDAGDWDLCIDRTRVEYWRAGMPYAVRVPWDSDEAVLEQIVERVETGSVRSRSGVPVELRGLVEVAPESPLEPSEPILLRVRVEDALGPRWDSAYVDLTAAAMGFDARGEGTTTQLDGEQIDDLLLRIRPLLDDADPQVAAALEEGDVVLAVMHVQSAVQPSGLATVDSAAVVVTFAPRWDDAGGYHSLDIVCEVDSLSVRPLACRADQRYTSAEQIALEQRGETVTPAQRRWIEAFVDGYRPDSRQPAFTPADLGWILGMPEDGALAAGDGYAWVRVTLSRSHADGEVSVAMPSSVAVNLRPVNPDDPDSPFEIAHHLCSSLAPCSIQHAY